MAAAVARMGRAISLLFSTPAGSRNRVFFSASTSIGIKRPELEDDEDAATIFRALSSCRPNDLPVLARTLSSTGILLTNPIIERVLLRCRFAHTNPHLALDLYRLASLRRGFFHSPLSLHTLLYILSRSRLFPLCLSLFRLSHPSIVTPRALDFFLARVAKICSFCQTLHSFRLCAALCDPSSRTACLNALLRALVHERKSMPDACRAFHSLKRRFPPDIATFNILLSGWTSPSDARAFFHEMLALGLSPDLVSYNSLIDCHCKSREIAEGLQLLQEMRDKGIDPDVITYTTLISGLGLAARPDDARKLLGEMREYGCPPDTPAYNAAIRNFCIARRLGDAFALLEEMKERAGLSPNAATFNSFFRCFYRGNELRGAWDLYRRMKEIERCLPNTQTCMFLARLFHRHERADLAMELWGDMVSQGFGSLTLVSDVLFDLLCDLGKVKEAENCFVQMMNKGHRPSHSSFRRIRVLMELAGMHDSIENLSSMMSSFSSSRPWSGGSEILDMEIEESTRRWHAS